MSLRAITLGVLEQVRASLKDPLGRRCGLSVDGRPPFSQAGFFVAVQGSGLATLWARPGGRLKSYSVAATITQVVSGIPADRRAVVANSPKAGSDDDHRTGLEELAEQLGDWIVMRPEVLAAANAIIGEGSNGFQEPFEAVTISPIEERDSSWFHGEGGGKTVMVVTLTFSGAKRLHLVG
jgi:hypothetical protein